MPSDERRRLSAMTSAEKLSPVIETTVRHTPFVAMLSPILVSSSTVFACIVSRAPFAPCSMRRTVPISSIMPVNKS